MNVVVGAAALSLALSWIVIVEAVDAATAPLTSQAYDPLNGTVPPSNWKWTSCYGNLPSDTTYSFAGSYEDFGVVTSSTNEAFVVDLHNGTTIQSKNLSLPNMSNPITYQALPNGMLLQMGWATMAAWSLPELELMWSVETFQLTGPAVLSTTGRFLCLSLSAYEENTQYPSCFRVSDGSLLWTSLGNISMAPDTWIYESQGILVVDQIPQQYPYEQFVTAIEVETGTYLWSSSKSLRDFFLAYEDLVVVLSPGTYQSSKVSALNIRTGEFVWNQTKCREIGSLATHTGVAFGRGAALWIRNGSCIWIEPEPMYGSPSLLSEPPVGSSAKPTFLFSIIHPTGFNYTIGDVMTGELAPPVEVVTPSSWQIFSSELGYYFFAVHPLGSIGNRYCLHAFPLNL